MGKLIVISAPSGAGKTSIVKDILKKRKDISFSVSACSREKRDQENNGEDYYFLGLKQFQQKINEGAFLEWEEVYENQYYGTLKSEVEKIWSEGKTVLFDVDVVGALTLKKYFSSDALTIFIDPPSLKELENRLINRGVNSPDDLKERLEKAKIEIEMKSNFDYSITNDNLENAKSDIFKKVDSFLNN